MKLFEIETSEGTVYALGEDYYGDDARDLVEIYLRERFPGGRHPYIVSVKLFADSENNSSVNKLITK